MRIHQYVKNAHHSRGWRKLGWALWVVFMFLFWSGVKAQKNMDGRHRH